MSGRYLVSNPLSKPHQDRQRLCPVLSASVSRAQRCSDSSSAPTVALEELLNAIFGCDVVILQVIVGPVSTAVHHNKEG